jgi:chaperonin cofactor prefoldin
MKEAFYNTQIENTNKMETYEIKMTKLENEIKILQSKNDDIEKEINAQINQKLIDLKLIH